MAKNTAAKWRLYEGVGFDANRDTTNWEYIPSPHYVVLMQSMHSGTEVFGPFVSEDAAHKWVREEGDGEMYQRFNRTSIPGVSFHVEWLDIPTKRECN